MCACSMAFVKCVGVCVHFTACMTDLGSLTLLFCLSFYDEMLISSNVYICHFTLEQMMERTHTRFKWTKCKCDTNTGKSIRVRYRVEWWANVRCGSVIYLQLKCGSIILHVCFSIV